MSNVLKMLSRGGAAAAETDPNFKQTVLLLHGDGTNGAQNNTFLDSSTNNFTITRNGNTTQGTFSPFSVGTNEWSVFFNSSASAYAQLEDAVPLQLGTDNFTIEAWIYTVSNNTQQPICCKGGSSSGFQIEISSTNKLSFIDGTTANDSTNNVSVNAWTHIAVVREGTGTNQTKIYINGVASGSFTVSTDFIQTNRFRISTNRTGNVFFNGYISNLRVVKGTAVYTTAFTPSTTPLTAITNTSLLTCQSNNFIDKSSNNYAITIVGTRVTPFSPFAPTAAYSAGTNGGSGYFDGTGDSLSIANAAALDLDANFTIEAWIYPTSLPNTFQTIVITSDNTTGAGGIGIWARSTGEIQVYSIPASSAIIDTSGFGLTVNQWTHIAVTRSGSTVTLYKNGVSFTTGTSSSNFNSSTPTVIGNSTSASQGFFGYISGLRILKGTAQAPDITQPPTNITNTSLLLNFTNAGIFDNTGKNNLETVGNAQIDTAVKKFGTGSLEFDGSGDSLKIPSSIDFQFGTGDLTVECWFYANSFSAGDNNYIIDFRPSASNGYPLIFIRPNGTSIWLFVDGAARITGASISTSQWYHVAWTRSGTSSKLFLNGTQTGSTWTDTTNYLAGRPNIAAAWDASSVLNGYIDDLRITKGVARYTADFTPPTKEFPDL